MIANNNIQPAKPSSIVNLSVLFGFIAVALIAVTNNPIIAIVASTIPIVLVVILYRPEMGLALLMLIAYINLSAVIVNIYEGPSLLKPLIPAIFVLAILDHFIKGKYLPNLMTSVPFLIAHGLVIALTLFIARDISLTLEGLEVYIKNAIIVITMVLIIRDFRTMRIIIWSLLLAGFFLGALSVFQQVTQTFDNIYWGFAQVEVEEVINGVKTVRIGGPWLATNQFAMIMLALVPLGLDRFLSEKKWPLKTLAFLSALFSFLTVTFTFSRSGFLALAVGVLVWVVMRGIHLKILFAILLFGLTLIPFIPSQYEDRISSLNEIYVALVESDVHAISDLSFRGRLSEQIAGWRMFRDHPILGVGYDNYDVYYLEYSEKIGLDGRREERQAHNLYLEILAETGIVGFAVFSIFLLFSIANLLHARKLLARIGNSEQALLAGAILASLAGYLAGSLFMHASHPRYFWIIMGIVLCVPLITQNILTELDETG